MSYAAYYTRVGISAPQGFGVMVAAWLAINVYNGKPTFYTKQISKAEFNATPLNYLQSPEHNQKAFPKAGARPDHCPRWPGRASAQGCTFQGRAPLRAPK
ncbi:uncharacterized protein HaLaN_05509, partial [Haematococcus lacustris]